MAVYQGSLTVKRRPKDGGPGKPGKDGIDIQIDNPNLIVTENSGSRDYSKTGFKIKVVQGGHSFNYFGANMTVLQERSWTCEIIEANNITGFTPPGPYSVGVTNAVFPPITDLSGDAGYIVLRFHIRDATMVYQFVDKRIQYNLSGKSGKDAINIHIDSTNLVILESDGERDYSNTGLKIRITQGGWDLDYMGIYAAHPGSWLCSVAESSNVTGFTIPIGGVGVYDLNIPPITKLTGSSGYIVLRFDITDRYGVRQFVDRRIQYTVTGRGYDGMPGQVPIQKEWVVGDKHRFNDEIKDYIYVRGTSSNTSYWYTRTSKGPDVDAGPAPVGGENVEGYTRVDWMRNLAVMVLLAEEANLANFIFKKEQLISVKGTVNGGETNYSGQKNFKPYIILDGKSGKIYAEGAEISGVINATSGKFTGALASPFERTKSTYAKDFSNNLIVTGDTFILPWDQLGSGRLIRLIQPNPGTPYCTAPTGKYFYEDGEQKNTLTMLGAEIIELLGYTDSQGNFTGWLVLNRGLLHTVSTWGEPHRIVAHGHVKTNNPFKYHTFDGSTLTTSTGDLNSRRYTSIVMPSGWFDSVDGYYVKIIANGGDSSAFHIVDKISNYNFLVYQHSLNVSGALIRATTFDFYFEIYSAAWLYPKSGSGGGGMPGEEW